MAHPRAPDVSKEWNTLAPPPHLQEAPVGEALLLHGPLVAGARSKQLAQRRQHGGRPRLQVEDDLLADRAKGVETCYIQLAPVISSTGVSQQAGAKPELVASRTAAPHTPALQLAPTSSVRAKLLSVPFVESLTSWCRAHSLTRRTSAPTRQSNCRVEGVQGPSRTHR